MDHGQQFKVITFPVRGFTNEIAQMREIDFARSNGDGVVAGSVK